MKEACAHQSITWFQRSQVTRGIERTSPCDSPNTCGGFGGHRCHRATHRLGTGSYHFFCVRTVRPAIGQYWKERGPDSCPVFFLQRPLELTGRLRQWQPKDCEDSSWYFANRWRTLQLGQTHFNHRGYSRFTLMYWFELYPWTSELRRLKLLYFPTHTRDPFFFLPKYRKKTVGNIENHLWGTQYNTFFQVFAHSAQGNVMVRWSAPLRCTMIAIAYWPTRLLIFLL